MPQKPETVTVRTRDLLALGDSIWRTQCSDDSKILWRNVDALGRRWARLAMQYGLADPESPSETGGAS